LGVGYIIGLRLAALQFSGGVLAWGLMVPLLMYFLGPQLKQYIPADTPDDWATMATAVWRFIVRPIAVGGMLVGAAYTLYKMRASLTAGLGKAFSDLRQTAEQQAKLSRTERYMSSKIVFGLIAVVFLFLTFGEGQRGAVYLIHAMPLYGSILAFFIEWVLSRSRTTVSIAAVGVAGFLALQAGGAALRASENTYGRRYDPAMTYVRERSRPDELVMGSVACAFGVGLDRGLLSDNLLGYYSGKVPDWVIVDDFFRESFGIDALRRPCIFRHVQDVLQQYDKVFDRDGVEVYRLRRQRSPGRSPAPTLPAAGRSKALAGAPRACRSTGQ